MIVFAHHLRVLDAIEHSVGKKVSYIRIDGSTKMQDRNQAVHDFQEQPSVRLAILSITAAGVRHACNT